jgi:hypothetical protein
MMKFDYPEHQSVLLPPGYGSSKGALLLLYWIKTNKIDAYMNRIAGGYRVYFKSADDAMWAKLSFMI